MPEDYKFIVSPREGPSANDKQVGGDHYRLPIQPWDFIVANDIGFLEGNAIKYICRHKKTNSGKKDLEKAIHYLQKALEVYYSAPFSEEEKKLAQQLAHPEPGRTYCDRCDGCGWYEGGPTLQTTCEKCNGTGVLARAAGP